MGKLNLFVPLWQDSGHSNEIFHGSHALKRLLEKEVEFVEVEIAERAATAISHGIHGYETLLAQLRAIRETLEGEAPDRLFVLGGGCGVDVAAVPYLAGRHGDLELFWFDAHGDLNSPVSSPSKCFHGMPVRFLLEPIEGNGISALVPRQIAPSRITLMGTRDLDAPEKSYIRDRAIRVLSPDECSGDPQLLSAIACNGHGGAAYIHLDLDVIDPGEYRNVKCPAAGGLTIERTAQIVDMIMAARRVVGMSVLENVETSPRELEKLTPLLERALGV